MRMNESLVLAAVAIMLASGANAASEQGEARREQSATRRSAAERDREREREREGRSDESEHRGDVSGRVLNPDGTPAIGVTVTAVVQVREEHVPPEVFNGTTDANGAFEFPEVLPSDEPWDLSVLATAAGFALEASNVSSGRAERGARGGRVEPLRMRFERAQPVRLRFVDVNRAPVAGVSAFTMRRVTADGSDNFLPLAGAGAVIKTSGADGTVTVEDFSPGDRVTLGIRPPGKQWEMRSFVADQSTELLLAPAPNGGVAGSVRDADGEPIVGANVFIVTTTWTGATTTARPFATRTRTEGTFLTRDICTLGERYGLLVTAAARGYAFKSLETVQELGAAMGAVDFTLEPSVSLNLRVLDAVGQPLVGARVCPARRVTTMDVTHVVAVKAADRITLTTDAKGMVTLDGFAAGDHATVEVSQRGKPSTQLSFDVAGAGDVEVQVKP